MLHLVPESEIASHSGPPPMLVFTALISQCPLTPPLVPRAAASSLPVNTAHPSLPSVLSCPLPGGHAPSQLPRAIQTFTNEVQLGLLLSRPFELELLVVAVEFLPSEEDKGGLRNGISRISASPRCQPQNTRGPEPWAPQTPTPLSPFAHQPGQSQVTNDGQNDDPTGCDEIAESTF